MDQEELFKVKVRSPGKRKRKIRKYAPKTIKDPGMKSSLVKKPTLPVLIFLTKRHSINSVYYGPGKVRVPAGVAATLLENEQRAATNEAIFQDKERARVILPSRTGIGYRARPVAADTFYESWTGGQPIAQVSGKEFPNQ